MIAAKHCLYWTMLALLLSPAAAHTDTDIKIQKLYGQGKAAFEKQDYAGAIATCDKALRLDPKCAIIHLARGHAHRMAHHFDRALADYGKAIRLLRDDPRTYDIRGFVGIAADYREALRLHGLLADTYASRADAYAEKQDFDQAITDLAKAISLEPGDGKLYLHRSFIHAARKDFCRALADCDHLIRLAPGQADSYFYRGTLYLKLKDFEHALADLDESIRLNPQYSEAYYFRGTLYLSRMEYARAIRDFQETIRLNAQHAPAYFALAYLFTACPQGELRDLQKGVDYARKGCEATHWREQRGDEIETRQFIIPLRVAPVRCKVIEKIRLFVSEDQGKTWKHEKDYKPSDNRIIFMAPHDGPYWFAIQEVLKDGCRKPADVEGLVPARQVYVNSTGTAFKSYQHDEALEREVELLRLTVDELLKKNKQLESDHKPK